MAKTADGRISIRDVANAAGVSTGTVSRVLNDHPDVSPTSRERVRAAIATLGYRPSPVGRALSKRSIDAVGILIPDMAHHVFMLEAQAIETIASRYGYAVMLADSDRNDDRLLRTGDLMAQYAVSGIIVIGGGRHSDRELVRRIGQIPTVVLGRRSGGRVFPAVTVDHYAAARAAVAHLLELGHRRIAAVRGDPSSEAGVERHRGYADALAEAGIAVDADLVVGGSFEVAQGRAALETLLDRPTLPTAIVFPNDEVALAGMRLLKDRGLRIPEDVSVVSFDDIPFAELADPPLTTVRTPAREMGIFAMQMLIDLIEGRGQVRDVVLNPELIVRRSTGPAARRTTGAESTKEEPWR